MSELGPLLELQHYDSEADRLRARIDDLPEAATVRDLETELRRGRAALAQAAEKATEARREQDRLETQLGMLESKAASVADRLYGRAGVVSSPKELQALQADLDMINRQKSDLEEEVLAAMESREEAVGLEKRTEEAVGDLERRLAQASDALEVTRKDIEVTLREVEIKREAVRPSVPADVLSLYDRIRAQQSDGVAAAPLNGGVCGGCQLRLPAAEYEAARHSSGVVRCEACRRILVVA